MSDIQHQQQHQQWQEYFDLIQRASQSRSDAIQLQKAVNNALKETKNEENTSDFTSSHSH
jgi:ABC-type amino acid transport substrate-binding protein